MLEKQIDEPRLITRDDIGLPFAGKAVHGELRFSRKIAYRNSFLPMIRATFEPSDRDGARVHVRMRIPTVVMVFMTAWLTGATLGALACVYAALFRGELFALVGLALPLFGAVLVTIPFALEARVAERLLRETFEPAPALPVAPDTGQAFR